MEKGKLIKKFEIKSGNSKRSGELWRVQEILVEFTHTFEDGLSYSWKVAIKCMNEEVDKLDAIPEGSDINISYRVSAREYNGRWYNDVMCRDINCITAPTDNDLHDF